MKEVEFLYNFRNRNNSENHQDGYDSQSKLQIFLKLTTKDNRVQGAFLETGSAVFTMMVMMVMLLGTGIGHINR